MLTEITQAIADARRFREGLGVKKGAPPTARDGAMAAAVMRVIRDNRDGMVREVKAEVDWGTHGIVTPDCVDISEAATDAVIELIGGE